MASPNFSVRPYLHAHTQKDDKYCSMVVWEVWLGYMKACQTIVHPWLLILDFPKVQRFQFSILILTDEMVELYVVLPIKTDQISLSSTGFNPDDDYSRQYAAQRIRKNTCFSQILTTALFWKVFKVSICLVELRLNHGQPKAKWNCLYVEPLSKISEHGA